MRPLDPDLPQQPVDQPDVGIEYPGKEIGDGQHRHNRRHVKGRAPEGQPAHLLVEHEGQQVADNHGQRHGSGGVNGGHAQRLPEQPVLKHLLVVFQPDQLGRLEDVVFVE